MAQKINKSFLDNLEPPKSGNRVYYDTQVPGFGVRVTAKGVKSFVFNYRNMVQRERRITIGRCNCMSMTDAREEAKRLYGEVALGGDPLAEKRELREAPTVNDLARDFRESHFGRLRPATRDDYEKHLQTYILKTFGSLKVADLAHKDAETLHRKITRRGAPYEANRVLATFSKMMTLAVTRGWRGDNPCRGVERNPEEKRKRYLNADELAALALALTEAEDKQGANVIRLLILTGARSGETMAAKWEDIDFEAGVWTKPGATTKQKTLHQIPLSKDAIQLLRRIEAEAAANAVYIFPSVGKTGHRKTLYGVWEKVRKAGGFPDARIHDLRHTYASVLVNAGMGLPVIGAMLGHTQVSTTARYTHLQDAPLREAAERAAAIITGQPSAEVVKLKGRNNR